MIKGRPPRLERIIPDPPLFFVTFCTRDRRKLEPLPLAHSTFEAYGRRALAEFDIAVGRYVIMPDHIHLFVRGGPEFLLSPWIGGLKRSLSVALEIQKLWQPGFFENVLRSDESYGQKWEYVRDNPARAGLVEESEDWPHQGEIVIIDRV